MYISNVKNFSTGSRELYSLKQLKKIIQNLNISNEKEYKEFYRKKTDSKIPSKPYVKYKNKGWKGWPSFFERKRNKVVSYFEAKNKIKKFKFNSLKEFKQYRSKNFIPLVPLSPEKSFHKKILYVIPETKKKFYSNLNYAIN